jgi:lipopolysaccharide biosynthesis protein
MRGWERLGMIAQRPRPGKAVAWRAAEKVGYDMSLVESNLRKTPYERIRAHNRALATAVMLRQAMEQQRARP